MNIHWIAKANEPAPHRLDSQTRVQIVLALELLVSWLSPRVPHELEFFFQFQLTLDLDCNAC
jgi:hypothetical protein